MAETLRPGWLAAVPAILCAWACSGSVVGSGGTRAAAFGTTGGTGATSGGGAAGAGGASSAAGGGAQGGGGGGGSGGGCPQGEMLCAGSCVDLATDSQNCGACGAACAMAAPHASSICSQGTCSLVMCDPGWQDCACVPADGCCNDIENDPQSCGQCGTPCDLPHATAACVQGMCVIAMCDPGWTDCDMQAADGCEADLQSDVMNCGFCGDACSFGKTCSGGTCQ